MTKIVERVLLSRKDTPFDARFIDEHRRVNRTLERRSVYLRTTDRGEKVVTYTTAYMYKGRTSWRADAKEFTRWSTDQFQSYRRTKGGALLRTWGGFSARGRCYSELLLAPRRVEVEVAEHLGEPVRVAEYWPLLSHYMPNLIDGSGWSLAGVRQAFVGVHDMQALTRNLFGASRYRKDLVKAVAQGNIADIAFAWQFRGLVPIDWIINRINNGQIGRTPGAVMVRDHLRALDQRSLRRLLAEAPSHWELSDFRRMPPVADLTRVDSWRDLHDRLAEHQRAYSHLQRKRVRPVKLSEEAASIEGTTGSGLTIVLANHEDQLWEWGSVMRNCIGSYGGKMRSEASWLGGVYDPKGNLLANFEIDRRHREAQDYGVPPRLNQLLGKANSPLDSHILTDVETHLQSAGVEVPRRYWGSQRLAAA